MPHALIIDDDPGFTPALAEFVKQQGFVVTTASTLNQARAALAAGPAPDVTLVDLILPDGSGLDLIREHDTRSETLRERSPAGPPSISIGKILESPRARCIVKKVWGFRQICG